MTSPLRVLIVEDNPNDAELMLRELRRAGFTVECSRVDSEPEFLAALETRPDIILSDHSLPQFDGLRAVELTRASGQDIPLVLISGTIGEEIAVQAIQLGAADYLLKDRLTRLGPAVIQALAAKRLRAERKEAETALKLFRSLVEHVDDAIEVIDPETGRFLDMNEKGCHDLGFSREEILSRTVPDINPTLDLAAFARNVDATRRLGSRTFETVHRRKDGFTFPVEIAATYIQNERDYLVAVARDITERKKAEAEVKRQRNELQLILDAVPAMIFYKDWEGRFIRVNRGLAEALDLPPEQIIGKTAADLGLPSAEGYLADDLQVMTTGTPIRHREETLRTVSGERWLRTDKMPHRDESGRVAGLIGISVDVTDQKLAEAAQHQSEARKAAIFASALDALVTMDGRGTVLEWNPAAERIFGYRREEAVGREMAAMIIPPQLREAHRQGLAHFLATGEGPVLRKLVELTAMRADGTEFPVELFITPIQTEPPLFTGFIRDITGRRVAEERIHQLAAFPELNPNPVLEFSAEGALTYHNRAAAELARSIGASEVGALLPDGTGEMIRACLDDGQPRLRVETTHGPRTLSWSFHPIGELSAVHCYVSEVTERLRLEEQLRQSQKMEAIGQLAGGVAHDFNNILTVIMGNTDLLSGEASLSPGARELNQQVTEAAERAANLTRQLLLFSRRQVLQPRLLDLNDLVTSLTRMLQRIVGEDVRLQLNLHPRPLNVQADAGMLDQVLMNLVVNARDAMPRGGRLGIETAERTFTAEEAALIPDASPGRYACLRVTDSGGGIAPEILPRIFEPFFTTKEAGKGTGLGLATVFGIVKQHGGALQIESEVGLGTAFHILLPVAEVAEVSSGKAVANPLPRGTETVLVVEDEPNVRLLTRVILERHGYQVLEAAHGVEALQVWERTSVPIHLLFTDLVMPEGVSGRELAARLRERSPGLRVIFTSGYSAEIAGRELRLEPGQLFLQKPAPLATMVETVRRCLDGD